MSEAPKLTPGEIRNFTDAIRSLATSESFKETFIKELERTGFFEEFTRFLSERMGQSEEVAGLARALATRSGDSRGDIILKALRLYELALDAVEHGNSLVVVNPDDEIIEEITGFSPAGAVDRPVAR